MGNAAQGLAGDFCLGAGARDEDPRIRVVAADGKSVPGGEHRCAHSSPQISFPVRGQVDADERRSGEAGGRDVPLQGGRAEFPVDYVIDRPLVRLGAGHAGKPTLAALRAPVTFQPEHSKRFVTSLFRRPGFSPEPKIERRSQARAVTLQVGQAALPEHRRSDRLARLHGSDVTAVVADLQAGGEVGRRPQVEPLWDRQADKRRARDAQQAPPFVGVWKQVDGGGRGHCQRTASLRAVVLADHPDHDVSRKDHGARHPFPLRLITGQRQRRAVYLQRQQATAEIVSGGYPTGYMGAGAYGPPRVPLLAGDSGPLLEPGEPNGPAPFDEDGRAGIDLSEHPVPRTGAPGQRIGQFQERQVGEAFFAHEADESGALCITGAHQQLTGSDVVGGGEHERVRDHEPRAHRPA